MYAVVPGYVVKISENLGMDVAAPLLCTGITVFNPMKDNDLIESLRKKIGLVGLGGLCHIAVKFGKDFGHHLTVISTSASKEKWQKRLGADEFIVTKNPQQMEENIGSHIRYSIGPILELLKVHGTLVIVAAPYKPLPVLIFPFIFGKRAVKGRTIGGIKEMQKMMDLCGKCNISCDFSFLY